MHARARFILLIMVLAAAGTGVYLWRDKEARNGKAELRVSGAIETTEVQASFKHPGRVAVRAVTEGDTITNSHVLAELDTIDLQLEEGALSADVRAATAFLAELEHGSRTQELRQAATALLRTMAEAREKSNDFARQQVLFDQKVISSREYESAKSIFEVTQARMNEQRETLRLLEAGPRLERIEQARAALEQRRLQLAQVQQRLVDAVLRAPFSGVVLSKAIEPGEYVMAGTPVVAIANLDEVWLRAYIDEPDLGRVQHGQRAQVYSDSYPGKAYEGVITFISSETEFTPKTVQTAKERVKLVYRIKITIPNLARELKPGMPADAVIDTTP